jgi:hypothetical protein
MRKVATTFHLELLISCTIQVFHIIREAGWSEKNNHFRPIYLTGSWSRAKSSVRHLRPAYLMRRQTD